MGGTGAEVSRSISIHALREERDAPSKDTSISRDISIHALREERDGHTVGWVCRRISISIHALREERDQGICC